MIFWGLTLSFETGLEEIQAGRKIDHFTIEAKCKAEPMRRTSPLGGHLKGKTWPNEVSERGRLAHAQILGQ